MGGTTSAPLVEVPIEGTILLLGAESTGKSTFLRHAQALQRAHDSRGPFYPDGMTTQMKQGYASDMRWNAVNAMRNVLASSDHLREYREVLARTLSSLPRTDFEAQMACIRTVYELWKHPVVREAVTKQLPVSLAVLATGVEERLFALLPFMVKEKWLPTATQTALVRSPTSQVVCSDLLVGKPDAHRLYSVWDVGGSRESRRKWEFLYDKDLCAVIFFLAPVDELNTNSTVYKLAEDFQLWFVISRIEQLLNIKMVVFLNKMDRFPFSSQYHFTITQLEHSLGPSVFFPSPLLVLVREYAIDSLTLLEHCLQSTQSPDETPIQFVRRRVLECRPEAHLIECDATDPISVQAALDALEQCLCS